MIEKQNMSSGLEIAVIGMIGRFPGAPTLEQFWENIRAGVEAIAHFSDEEVAGAGVQPELLNHPQYVKAGGVVADPELFDAGFFGYTPREAESLDPQQRMFLECAWEALEQAGYTTQNYRGLIGVYAGCSTSSYLLQHLLSNPAFLATIDRHQVLMNNEKDFLATRVSYHLDLEGPSIVIQTACSTSLVAIHMACQGLLSGECDMALAGGVSLNLPQKAGYLYQTGGILSPDGHCRAFDAGAQGTVVGSGLGIVVLKPLERALQDRDTIHAVIKGSAVNNDGARKVGYTAPRVEGQAAAIRAAHQVAEVEPETISYVEAHGTGTALGDPIELAALTQAFETDLPRQRICALGSVKTEIGHLDAAAGVAGFLKTVLALKHAVLPPSPYFEHAHPDVHLEEGPFYLPKEPLPWPAQAQPRRAGVSSFGMGGTNAHLVLEEAPLLEQAEQESPAWQLLLLSARTPAALSTQCRQLASYLQAHPEVPLADVAFTLQLGRKTFAHRLICLCRSHAEAIASLEQQQASALLTAKQEASERPVVFLFSGQGSQYPGMGKELYQQEPVFRRWVDRCLELLAPLLDCSLAALLYPSEQDASEAARLLQQTHLTQPALFVIEYALAQLWISWGVKPRAMLGHSIGEYVAACLAGTLTLEDALRLVTLRGRLMQELPQGSMLSIHLPLAEVRPWLDDALALAAHNAPELCVVSGPTERIERLERELQQQDVTCRRLHVSHAFHSAMMEPMLATFAGHVRQISLQPPQLPFISNLTGKWITAAEATDPNYWVRHLRHTVSFYEGLQLLAQEKNMLLLEVGPGHTLSDFARQGLATPGASVFSSLRHPKDPQSDRAFLLTTLGKLWLAGASITWAGVYKHAPGRRIPLPTYPFERQFYWVEPSGLPTMHASPALAQEQAPLQAAAEAVTFHQRAASLTSYVGAETALQESLVPIWEQMLGVAPVGIHDHFFELGGHSLLATRILARMQDVLPVTLSADALFQAPTIAQLALLIEQEQERAEQEFLQQMIREIQNLSPEEIEARLTQEHAVALEQEHE